MPNTHPTQVNTTSPTVTVGDINPAWIDLNLDDDTITAITTWPSRVVNNATHPRYLDPDFIEAFPDGTFIFTKGDGTVLRVEPGGAQWWTYKGSIHRTDGPAAVLHDSKQWWDKGRRHRSDDLPAAITINDSCEWWFGNQRHRVGGPAIVRANGTRQWWRRDEKHRDGGPVETRPTGHVEWRFRDDLNRPDGPALIDPDEEENVIQWWGFGSSPIASIRYHPRGF